MLSEKQDSNYFTDYMQSQNNVHSYVNSKNGDNSSAFGRGSFCAPTVCLFNSSLSSFMRTVYTGTGR